MIGTITTRLLDEARRIWCYRWLAVAVSALIFLAGVAYVLRLPDVYDAWGQVFVSKQTPLTTAAEGVSLVGDSYGSSYVVQKTLLNDQSLEAVVRLGNPMAAGMTKPAMASAIGQLRSRIHVSPDQGDGFVEFHYADSNPVRAQQTVKLLLDQFITRNVDRSRTDLGRAEKFLDEQIASYGTMVAESQSRIVDFRRQHPEVAVVPLPPGFEMMAEGQGVGPAPAAAPAQPAAPRPTRSAADERVASLEAKLASLRTTYTEQYPDVVAVKRQLADATAERDSERALAATESAGAPQGGAAPASRAAARAPRRMVGTRLPPPLPPEVAAQWLDLQRKDEVLRLGYQQLIGRREATRMSQAIYNDNGSGKYQVTRTPTVPTAPYGPKRPLYLAVAALLAIGGGLGAAYLRAGIKGILVAPRELEDAFQLPVVGTVSLERAWHMRRPARPRKHKSLPLPATSA